MKKLFILFISALFLSACGGSGTKENVPDSLQTVSPELQDIHKSSNDVKAKSEDLKQKADSFLNNI